MEIGQKVFLKPIGNYSKRETIEEATITKIGRKYFETDKHWLKRFDIVTMLQDCGQYTSNYKAYLSKQEIQNEFEAKRINEKLRNVPFMGLSLEQLKAIEKIIDQ